MNGKSLLDKDEREQRRLRRLGRANPSCACCPETDSRCLELHHIAGQKNDLDTVVTVCRNCHRKLSDEQLDHPPDATPEDVLKRIAHFLLGFADMLALIVDKLREFAAELFSYDTPSEDGESK